MTITLAMYDFYFFVCLSGFVCFIIGGFCGLWLYPRLDNKPDPDDYENAENRQKRGFDD